MHYVISLASFDAYVIILLPFEICENKMTEKRSSYILQQYIDNIE